MTNSKPSRIPFAFYCVFLEIYFFTIFHLFVVTWWVKVFLSPNSFRNNTLEKDIRPSMKLLFLSTKLYYGLHWLKQMPFILKHGKRWTSWQSVPSNRKDLFTNTTSNNVYHCNKLYTIEWITQKNFFFFFGKSLWSFI